MRRRPYIHALRYLWLNGTYDLLIRLTLADRRFKEQLLDRSGLQPQMRGTGLDGDTRILAVANQKRERTGDVFAPTTGLSTAVPFNSRTFDRVFSTFMRHHLDDSAEHATLRDIQRVLREGGELHIADWGRPHTPSMRIAARLVQAFDGPDTTRANLEGRIPEVCRAAGYNAVDLLGERRTVVGTLAFYRARNGEGS